MKKIRISVCLILIMAMLVCDCGVQVFAFSGDGKSLASPISLTLGKTKTAKIEPGQQNIYFSLNMNDVGKLNLSLVADKLGTDVDVEVSKSSNDLFVWKQNKTIQYNKSKKKLSGSLTSEYVLPRGFYIVTVNLKKSIKSAKKIKIKAQLKAAGYEDIEPNSSEENAQPMDVEGKNGNRTYKMLLTNVALLGNTDTMDWFSFKLKKSKQVHFKLSLKEAVEGISVLICKENAEGMDVVKRYDVTGKKLDKKVKLKKGRYYVKIWYYGNQKLQIPYTISGTVAQKVSSVKLNKSKLTLWLEKEYGPGSAKLKATVSPSNATNKKVKWKSSNPKVAKISSSGKVTALSVGRTIITVTAADGSKKSAKCVVTVKAPIPEISGVAKLTVGNTATYKTTVSGGKWKSSDESVLAFVSTGEKSVTVKAKKAGTASITYVANGMTSNKISVNVRAESKNDNPNPQPPATKPSISGPGVVWVGESITFTVTSGATGGSWYSDDTSILSGSGGGSSCTMTGRRAGTTYVYYKVNGVESNRIRVQVRGL